MSTPQCPFLALVEEGQPLTVHVVLTPSDDVVHLRNQVSDLQREVLALKQETIRAQNLYQGESVLNLELIDLCREHGVPVRQVLIDRQKGKGKGKKK